MTILGCFLVSAEPPRRVLRSHGNSSMFVTLSAPPQEGAILTGVNPPFHRGSPRSNLRDDVSPLLVYPMSGEKIAQRCAGSDQFVGPPGVRSPRRSSLGQELQDPPACVRRPLPNRSMVSRAPPGEQSVQTLGMPMAIASSIALGRPSTSDERTYMAQFRMRS